MAHVGLGAAFREGYAGESECPAVFSVDGLDQTLAALVAKGRIAYSDLALPETAFARHLGRCAARAGATTTEAVQSLAIADLYLACGCLLKVRGAAAKFDRRCADRTHAMLANAIKSAEYRKEIEQRARDVILVGSAEVPAKIGDYRGQASLDRWVAVVVHGLAINMLRAEDAEQRAREGAASEPLFAALQPEFVYAKHQYRADFEQALADTLTALGARERTILRLQLAKSVSVASIAKMYGVSQSTVSRWLAQARETIAISVRRLLEERLHIPSDEVGSLAGLLASEMDVSMSRLLDGALSQTADKG